MEATANLKETFALGRLTVVALSDGAPEREMAGFFNGVDAAEWTRALGITDPKQRVPFNFGAFLVVAPDGHATLVDTGLGAAGDAMRLPGGGEMLQRLTEIGVLPSQIDTVVHTHLHADHCGWDVRIGNQLTFANASIYVSEREVRYWTEEADPDQGATKAALRALGPAREAGRLETFDGEFAVAPHLTMVPTPGHTPGHCSVLLTSEGHHLVIAGDAAHHPVHFEHHDWIPAVDIDPEESQRSRGKLADLAIEKDAVVTGGHFPILTLGRIRRVESGYRWEPV